MLASVYRATLLGIRQRRHDGLPSGDLRALAVALRNAHEVALSRQKSADDVVRGSDSNSQDPSDSWVGTAEVSILLQTPRRTVQRWVASDPGGWGAHRAGKGWAVPLAPVLTLAAERRRRDGRQLPEQLGSEAHAADRTLG